VAAYISGLVEDEDEEVEDIVDMTRGMLDDSSLRTEPGKLDDLWVATSNSCPLL
jgi:ATP-binding cassette subfamily F protein 3